MDTNRARPMLVLASSVMLTFTFLVHSPGGFAAETPLVADLEQGFWVCDYVATTRGVQATPVDTCSAITDELKTRKFGGDFEELLEWWRANKVAEHQKLDAAATLK